MPTWTRSPSPSTSSNGSTNPAGGESCTRRNANPFSQTTLCGSKIGNGRRKRPRAPDRFSELVLTQVVTDHVLGIGGVLVPQGAQTAGGQVGELERVPAEHVDVVPHER
jgi:hypothetical protein